jgi:hypothetical protein
MFWEVHVLGLAPDLFLLLCLYFIFQPMKDISSVVSKVGHKPKIKIAISNFHSLHCYCLYWSILRQNLMGSCKFILQATAAVRWVGYTLTHPTYDSKGWPTEGPAKNLIQLQTPLLVIYQVVKEEEVVKLIRFFAWPYHPWVHLVTWKILVTCKTNKSPNFQYPSTWLYYVAIVVETPLNEDSVPCLWLQSSTWDHTLSLSLSRKLAIRVLSSQRTTLGSWQLWRTLQLKLK